MMLTVNKLSTRCRVPKGMEGSRALIEEVTEGQLVNELQGQLGPSLDRLPAVVRLKQLRIRVKVSARELTRLKLAGVWARAFALSLHKAMAHPAGEGEISLRRHASDAAYKAGMMHHAATQGLSGGWEFPELSQVRGATPAQAALSILLEAPESIPEIMAHLYRQDWLQSLLLKWDEACLEKIIRAVQPSDSETLGLSPASLLEIVAVISACKKLLPRSRSGARRQAVQLWTQLDQRLPLRSLWHGLRLLFTLVERPDILCSADASLPTDGIAFPGWCEALVAKLAAIPTSGERPPAGRKVSTDLLVALGGLRAQLPIVASAVRALHASEKWIESDSAGLLLMLSAVRRLNLWRLARSAAFSRFGGPRALSFLLAGLGMTLLKPWRIGDPLDPLAALFAGIVAEPDRNGMAQFFSQAAVTAVADFVEADTWADVLQAMATELARSFAGRVHGFRTASRQTVLKQFLRIPGRVLVEDTRLWVVLEPSAWSVALHISSMDAALESVEWLGGRRVEFTLQGL